MILYSAHCPFPFARGKHHASFIISRQHEISSGDVSGGGGFPLLFPLFSFCGHHTDRDLFFGSKKWDFLSLRREIREH